jgi:hypothetical protein
MQEVGLAAQIHGGNPTLGPLLKKEAESGVAQPMMIWSAATVILTASWKVYPSFG